MIEQTNYGDIQRRSFIEDLMFDLSNQGRGYLSGDFEEDSIGELVLKGSQHRADVLNFLGKSDLGVSSVEWFDKGGCVVVRFNSGRRSYEVDLDCLFKNC